MSGGIWQEAGVLLMFPRNYTVRFRLVFQQRAIEPETKPAQKWSVLGYIHTSFGMGISAVCEARIICGVMCRPTVFVHAYNSTGKDSSSEDEEKEEEQDWKALMPFKYTVTNQTEVLEKYECASSSLHRAAPGCSGASNTVQLRHACTWSLESHVACSLMSVLCLQ